MGRRGSCLTICRSRRARRAPGRYFLVSCDDSGTRTRGIVRQVKLPKRVGLHRIVAIAGMTSAPRPAVAQDPFIFDRRYAGCYDVQVQERPKWLEGIEDGIHLTTARLSSPRRSQVPEFVVRAAPGHRASGYPRVSWVLIGGEGPLQITWEHPMEWIVAKFDVRSFDPPPELRGSVENSSDLPSYAPEPVAIRLVRVECTSVP